MIIIKRFTDLFYGRIINFYNHTMCFWEECIVSNLWLNTLCFSTGSILCVIQTFYLFINYSPVWSVHYRGMCVWYHLQWLFSPTVFTPAFLLFLEQAKNSSSSGQYTHWSHCLECFYPTYAPGFLPHSFRLESSTSIPV